MLLSEFYPLAAGVTDSQQRRWVAGAAYLLAEAARNGEPVAAARTRILAVPQYANGLAAAGQTANFNAISGTVTGLTLPGTAGNYASTPDSAGLSITGDIDVRARVALTDWTPTVENVLVGKWDASGNGYLLTLNGGGNSGKLQFAVHTIAGVEFVLSNAILGLADGSTKWIRGTRVQATGVYALYTSDDGAAWTSVPGTVTSGTVNAITDGTPPVTIGANASAANLLNGSVYRVQILAGIGGAARADFDPTQVTRNSVRTPAGYTDAQGNVWTVNGTGWDWA